jgi:hypothetical protein
MGCDIHIFRERLVNSRWTAGDAWTEKVSCLDKTYWHCEEVGGARNYQLFGVLARVRCDEPLPLSFAPRGLPLQVSEEVAREAALWEGDAHNHSHLFLHELKELHCMMSAATIPVTGVKDGAGLAALRASIASSSPNWDLLYPYAKWTGNSIGWEPFSVDVPALFRVDPQLSEIIAGLESIGGEMQRVVFWFDN